MTEKKETQQEEEIPVHVHGPHCNHHQDHLHAQSHSREKIGRNDPFPCGSGKKYKKCCGSI